HDIDLTTGGKGTQAQAANIPVPTGDPYFDPANTGTQVIPFNRSEFDPTTGTSKSNPRQQTNDITSFIDASMIYGSDPAPAAALAAAHPNWSDEQLYQQARALVIAEVQSITFNEFLPALLGGSAVPGYQGYNPNVNPGIANEFSTAAFRLGHSLLAPDVEFMN